MLNMDVTKMCDGIGTNMSSVLSSQQPPLNMSADDLARLDQDMTNTDETPTTVLDIVDRKPLHIIVNDPETSDTKPSLQEAQEALMTIISYLHSLTNVDDSFSTILWKLHEFLLAMDNHESEPDVDNIMVDSSALPDTKPDALLLRTIVQDLKNQQETSDTCMDQPLDEEGPVQSPNSENVNEISKITLSKKPRKKRQPKGQRDKITKTRVKNTKEPKRIKETNPIITQYSCSTCGKIYAKSSHLKRHENDVHLGLKPHKCPVCHKAFTTVGNVTKHMRSHTGERPYLCNICGKSYFQCSSLQAHMVIHTGEKAFHCQQCEKSFSQKAQLNEHIASVHTKDRPFKCSLCDKSYIRQIYLDDHLIVHSGERTHTCEVCHKKYALKSHLRRHMAIHVEKRDECLTCGLKFYNKSLLKAHMRTHTGERPYKCQYCEKSFSQSGTLHNHYRMHKSVT